MSAPPPEQPPTASRRRRGGKGEKAHDPQRPPEEQAGHGVAEPPKLRRRPMLIALSVLLTALGALLGALLLQGISGTDSYIAVKEDITRGQVIEANDLQRTQLSTDAAVRPLGWDQQRLVIGKPAAFDMAAGSVVTRDSVDGELIPAEGHSTVGLALDPGQAPTSELSPGDPVRVVILGEDSTGTGGAGGANDDVPGRVISSTTSADGSVRHIDVMVVSGQATKVSAAAARRQVALVADSRANGTGFSEPAPSSEPASGSPSPTSSATD